MRRLALGAAILVLVLPSKAEPGFKDQLLKILCVGEESTGFSWRANDWKPVRFKPENYLVQKVPIDTHHPLCLSEMRYKQGVESKDGALEYGCYDIHEVGSKNYPLLSKLCFEQWNMAKGEMTLSTVFCDNEIYFKPNGLFEAIQWESKLDEKADYKDSLSITVGRCTEIKG